MRISLSHEYERRLGLFPAGFDQDGVMFCNQEFADYPIELPTSKIDPHQLTGKTMLISTGQPTTSSSARERHPATNAVVDDVQSWWAAASTTAGEWVQVELPTGSTTTAIQVNTIEHEPGLPRPNKGEGQKSALGHRLTYQDPVVVPFVLEGSSDGETWITLRDAREDGRSHDLVALPKPAPFRYVRVTGGAQPLGTPFAVSGLRVFGLGGQAAPAKIDPDVRRVAELHVRAEWPQSPDAHGFSARYGISPDKLYHAWQLPGDATSVDIRSVNAGHDYWVAIDVFNASGITRGTPVPATPSTPHVKKGSE